MAIELIATRDIPALRRAGQAAAQTLAAALARAAPGVTTGALDRFVRAHTRQLGGVPTQLGYHGFPAAVCTSRNHVVCHGIPSDAEVLVDGDILNIDVTTARDGFCGDTSATCFIGRPTPEARHVVEVARRCRDLGVSLVRPGVRLGDIGAAIEAYARAEGASVVRDYGGHGIGRSMHQDPHVPYVGPAGRGLRLRAGMAITIEPMINLGGHEVRLMDDGWTVVTADGSLSAQFEHTVLVTADGHEVTTRLDASTG